MLMPVTFLIVCWQLSLCGCGVEMEKQKNWAWGEVGVPLCLVAITTLSGVGSDPKMLEHKPRGLALAAAFPFKRYPPPHTHQDLCLTVGEC